LSASPVRVCSSQAQHQGGMKCRFGRRLPFWVAFLTLSENVSQALAVGTAGVRLTGGNSQTGEMPMVVFGPYPLTASTLTLHDGALQLIRGGETQISFDPQVMKLPYTVIPVPLDTAILAIHYTRQWALWRLDTFDTDTFDGQDINASDAWSVNDHSFCGTRQDTFLGGYCHFASTTTCKKYQQLPPHTRIRVRARVHFLDKWEGESVALVADGNTVWTRSHHWCPGFQTWMCRHYGISSCGHDTPDRLSVKVEATFAHSTPLLDLAFTSTLPAGTDPCTVSWGVDDVSVELI